MIQTGVNCTGHTSRAVMELLKDFLGFSDPTPWRKIPPDNKDDYLDYIKKFQLNKEGVEHLRIMLYGPPGAGKSSFINSVETILRGRMTCHALSDGFGDSCFTTKYQTHSIKKSNGTYYPFVFSDLMGLEKGKKRGVSLEDMVLAMKGHVKNGYEFNEQTPLSSADEVNYNCNPTVNDKTHVLVCVVPANTVNLLSAEFMKMREVRLAASELGIPQISILTKIDETCPEVKKNVKDALKNMLIKERTDKVHDLLGIPLNCIFPVKNYHSEVCPDDDIDKLTLMALKHMIQFGEDFVD